MGAFIGRLALKFKKIPVINYTLNQRYIKTEKQCDWSQLNFGEQGCMAQWREHSPPTNVARVRILVSILYVG